MEVLTVIGVIVLFILAFIFLGLFGWVLKAFGWIFDFLQEGCSTSFGCLFWVFIALFLLLGLLMM